MFTLPSNRSLYLIGFLICVALIGVALFMQHGLGYEPCPLCIAQRISFILIGLICLIAFMQNPQTLGHKVYGVLIGIAALFGLSLSIRHSWLQHNPPEFVECGGGLEYWLETLPTNKIIEKILQGTGECTDIVWKFLGLSIPEWTAIMYFGFVVFAIRQIFFVSRTRH